MNELINAKTTCFINLYDLDYLKMEVLNSEYIVTLTDLQGAEILKGYGNSMEEAINDLHHNLI
ncbi:hypothetical protein GCM10022393_33840 [Aquimarina addita]|uniref:Uncharacterized protein n=1 Tax=Aquimarina addita TaxID=870485 RepID=A0ABP6UQF6_9FLAO